MNDDLVNRLRDTACQGVELAIKNGRFVSPHEAADHIEKLEAELDRCRKSNAVMDNTVRELEADNARLREDNAKLNRHLETMRGAITVLAEETSHD